MVIHEIEAKTQASGKTWHFDVGRVSSIDAFQGKENEFVRDLDDDLDTQHRSGLISRFSRKFWFLWLQPMILPPDITNVRQEHGGSPTMRSR